jgi:hypothetical protein
MSAWYEFRLKRGVSPFDFYAAIHSLQYKRVHHFWDEPWWPKAYVVRVETDDVYSFEDNPHVDHFAPWDVSADEQAYGWCWPYVSRIFHDSSLLADVDEAVAHRLVHCMLNARGMSEWDEAKFAARFFWDRLTVKLRWRLYLKRQWERQQRAEVAA